MFNNLSKVFRYENEKGESLTFLYDYGFLINKPIGIDTISISLKRARGINQVGETVQSKSVQPRPINFSGMIVGNDQKKIKEQLLTVVHPDLSARLYADDYYLDVVPTDTPSISPESEFANFSFSLLAPYPYWQGEKTTSAILSGFAYCFRLPCNFSKEYRFAETLRDKLITIDNRGQLPVPYTLTLTAKGKCSMPKLTNATTGETIIVEKDMVPDEKITIRTTHERTYAESSVDGDIRGAISLESDLFRLPAGESILKPEAASGMDQLEAQISFAPERVGIWL